MTFSLSNYRLEGWKCSSINTGQTEAQKHEGQAYLASSPVYELVRHCERDGRGRGRTSGRKAGAFKGQTKRPDVFEAHLDR